MVFILGLLVGSLICIPIYKAHRSELLKVKEEHRKEFEDLIWKINHEGPIKEGVSAVGLMNLISWAIGNSIKKYWELYANKDYNTKAVTTELQEIAMVEFRLLYNKITDYMTAVRNHLNDYNHKQEE